MFERICKKCGHVYYKHKFIDVVQTRHKKFKITNNKCPFCGCIEYIE